jgi:predicted SprT family Zn-dependent metalloprotease
VLPEVADLQLMFAQFNYTYFDGEIPAHEISYNNRFSNVAGRITYKPPKIELSPKHLSGKPEQLRETLLHEMIHAWLFARNENPGHTARFKKKMRELGLRSIYHDLGTAPPLNENPKRYILRCGRRRDTGACTAGAAYSFSKSSRCARSTKASLAPRAARYSVKPLPEAVKSSPSVADWPNGLTPPKN